MLNPARLVLGLLGLSVLVLAFALGYVLRGDGGAAASDNNNQSSSDREFDFDQLNEIRDILEDKYVDPDRLDDETLYQQSIQGMLDTLTDSGTFYIDRATVQTSTGPSGTFEGIGATVAAQDGEIIIVAPIPDTPAERAGIRPGDVILEVDGESTANWTQEQAVLRIRGEQGTTVTLKVRHTDGEEEILEIERAEIEVESVTTQPPGGVLRDGEGNEITDVAYVQIREFDRPTLDQFKAAIDEIGLDGKRGLIIDVRNNPGGLLSTTVDIADEFLDEGIILTEQDRDGTERSFTARGGGSVTEIPMVVLQNRFSASGAEVLAAALSDNGRATLVGERSFGKGTVNVSNDLRDGGQLYVTIARWLTPDGTLIDGVGIRPEIEVTLSDEDIDLRRDVQLFKAIDILRGTDTTPPAALTPVATPTGPAATPTRPPGG
jgi:carboxyl-terminal processing protease